MGTEFLGVNVFAGVIAALLSMILGAFWYNRKVFGTMWAEIHGFESACLNPGYFQYFFAFLNTLVIVWVIGGFFSYFGIDTLGDALCFAFWGWLGFVATTHLSGVIWAKKPFKAYLIDVGFFLVALEIIAAIFAVAR